MEATINIDDRKTFQSLVQFLKAINMEVVTKKTKKKEGNFHITNELNKISLFSAREIFEDLGTDEDYKEWINAPEI